ncbi:sigma-70 family RNA polymerase sigma factor [Paenibacillus pinisoli]|uniref:Sigma-70 family RNA polymerase sigma factor n=1 Tax=Paenibacillus pinisoli TaxID=1276110 RepID=A0A3A6PIU3_9BACL|nr:sigma-70 family RNA polymerase sigma factor [Paenibacillus pinisoli]RJX39048.1 sigma-70 family RNA polymerase sigma factor [Paenibacillus pinisoli]
MTGQSSGLTPEHALMLMERYRLHECNESATQLLLHYESIVRMAAGKLSRSRPDLYEDLFQVGQMSMLRLFKQFDSEKGIPFEGYAMKSVIGHLKNFLRDKSWYIQVPRRIKEKGLLLQKAIDDLTVKLGRSPKIEDIAEVLELSVEETIEVMTSREAYQYVSLDMPLSSEGESAATVGDMIAGEADGFQALEGRMDLREAFGRLKEQEQHVLTLVYTHGLSQRDVAERLGVSQMSVSRIQRRAIERLKTLLADDDEEGGS